VSAYERLFELSGRSYWRVSNHDQPWKEGIRNGKRYRYPVGQKGWQKTPSPLCRDALKRMLSGQDRIAVSGFTHTRLIILDFDAHEEPPRPWWETHGIHPSIGAADSQKTLRRQWIAEQCSELVFAARMSLDEDVHVEMTPRGYHAFILLEDAVPVTEAARIAASWRSLVLTRTNDADPKRVESFPKINSDGTGRTCALPLGAGHRLVGRDITKPCSHLRAIEIERVVGGSGLVNVKALWDVLTPHITPVAIETIRPSDAVLCGSAFVLEVLRLLEQGMDDDESWPAIRILVAACCYRGLTRDETIRAMKRYVRCGIHRATHCQSERGMRQLDAVVRCQINHFERGLGEGTYRAGIKSRELNPMLDELASLSEVDQPRVAA